jgi:16S rRNA (cytidine1402-2'-O)-methyltransferase
MLYIVPTPLGNMRDITLRALDVLKAVHYILCEDTRRTQKILDAYEIKKPLVSFHEHSGIGKHLEILRRLKAGESYALVSDAGTPLISDPGFEIVRLAREAGVGVEVLPGACAVTTALVASGLATDSFAYHGFLSQKSASRKKELLHLSDREETLIFYESPHRLVKVLEDMLQVLGDREACVARELTKKFEEVSRGRLSQLISHYGAKSVLGEIVLVVSGRDRKLLFEKEPLI